MYVYFRTELIWKVGRYTSAAPVYITEMDNYVDGGVLANNPAMTGITHIQVPVTNLQTTIIFIIIAYCIYLHMHLL